MKQRNEYGLNERESLCTRYRKEGEMSQGSTSALKWYKRGIVIALKGAKYDQKTMNTIMIFKSTMNRMSEKN